jgi:hypothetical protein
MSAACPFDGKELLLEDAGAVEDTPSLAIRGLPTNG